MATWKKWTLSIACAGAFGSGLGATIAIGDRYQPHMQNALDDLSAAQSELESADPDKGGWRERALSDLSTVITDVQNGIAVGQEHHHHHHGDDDRGDNGYDGDERDDGDDDDNDYPPPPPPAPAPTPPVITN
jgi:hypothetical protein